MKITPTLPEEGYVRINQLLGLGSRRDQLPILPISRPTLYAWISEGKWPAPLKVGGTVMWSAAVVREALKSLSQAR
jgi:predicted DNA-binding transcriptional regulator AlpA